ncbi:MAG: putative DCC family thiol-disulfide oxidoreductase YuxK [Bermanella sp.]|jgi:predicted DCC family thiol-disulfide oxidoreductase YuxK
MNAFDLDKRAAPPIIDSGDRVILFDGVCKLCSAWTRFIIRVDRKHRFKLATVQSAEGQALLEWYGLPTDDYETMVLIEGNTLYTKTTALFRVLWRLPFPWQALGIGWLVPWFVRDWMYDRIARNRYALFGKYDVCLVPDKDHNKRFLRSE